MQTDMEMDMDTDMEMEDQAEGRNFKYDELLAITKGLSNPIGSGGFGVVYLGELSNGEKVAVKMLKENNTKQLDGEQFKMELKALQSVQHDNIVRFIGYCNETTSECFQGLDAIRTRRALCFEYIEKGSLRNHFTEESLDWHSRYEIIKGIIEGLNHLHSKEIVHRDLKPDNVLLDGAMKPKIADFGLSRFLDAGQTSQITPNTIKGTPGYVPPEFWDGQGQYSKEFDVYSLGTLIKEILTGPANVSIYGAYDLSYSLKKASEYWEQRLEAADVQRVKACIALVPKCLCSDRKERPTIERVIDTLNYTDISLGGQPYSRSYAEPEKSELLKGGGGGKPCDINMEVKPPPHRLKAVWIKHGEVIDSLMFSYTDCNGYEHHEGPWGPEECYDKIFELEPHEFLVKVSGTMGEFRNLPTNIIKSLTFVTNVKTYRTRGTPVGIPFTLEAPSKSCIVGFWARAECFLDAIGVYHRPIYS